MGQSRRTQSNLKAPWTLDMLLMGTCTRATFFCIQTASYFKKKITSFFASACQGKIKNFLIWSLGSEYTQL